MDQTALANKIGFQFMVIANWGTVILKHVQ